MAQSAASHISAPGFRQLAWSDGQPVTLAEKNAAYADVLRKAGLQQSAALVQHTLGPLLEAAGYSSTVYQRLSTLQHRSTEEWPLVPHRKSWPEDVYTVLGAFADKLAAAGVAPGSACVNKPNMPFVTGAGAFAALEAKGDANGALSVGLEAMKHSYEQEAIRRQKQGMPADLQTVTEAFVDLAGAAT